jgi:hypothetical protein
MEVTQNVKTEVENVRDALCVRKRGWFLALMIMHTGEETVRMNYTQFQDECIQYVKSLPNPFSENIVKAVDAGADVVLFSDKTYEKLIS